MHGNIAVGVSAARCVDKVRRGRAFFLRGAFITGLASLFVVGWMTHIPNEQTGHLLTSLRRIVGLNPQEFTGTVVRSTPEGIAVRSQGTTLTLMHPSSALVTMSGSSAVEARYVDEETGQVTITNVYGQQRYTTVPVSPIGGACRQFRRRGGCRSLDRRRVPSRLAGASRFLEPRAQHHAAEGRVYGA